MAKKEQPTISEDEYVDIQPKKKKKKHTGLKMFLIILLIIIVAPIATLYILFYDPGAKEVQKIEDFNAQVSNIVMGKVVDSFQNTATEAKASLPLDESFFDNLLLANLTSLIPEQFQKYVNSYVDIDEETKTFTFYIGADAIVFKTRLALRTKLSVSEDGLTYIFGIEDIGIGRIHGLQGFLGNFLNDNTLNDLFKKAKLSIKSDLANSRLTYDKIDVVGDVSAMLGAGSGDDLFSMLLNEFASYGNYDFKVGEDSLNFEIYLDGLAQNSDAIVLPGYTGIPNTEIERIKSTCTSAEFGSKTAEELSSYFSTEIKKLVPEPSPEEDLSKVLSRNVEFGGLPTDFNIPTPGSCFITAKNLNDYLKTQKSLIGFSYLLTSKDTVANKWKVAAIAITNLYCTIVDDTMHFIVTLNFNGYSTYLVVNCHRSDNSTPGIVVLDINGINFGKYTVGDKLRDFFIGELEKAMPTACAMHVTREFGGEPKLVLDYEQTVKDIITSKGGQIGTGPGQFSYEFGECPIIGFDPYDIDNCKMIADFEVTLHN